VRQLSTSAAVISTQPCFSVSEAINDCFQRSLSGCLQINSGAFAGYVYFRDGNLVYITHSIGSIIRLDLYLKELSDHLPILGIDVRNHLRLTLDPDANLEVHLPADLQGIVSLVQTCVLSVDEAQSLIETLSREALEALLLIQYGICTFVAIEHAVEHALNWVQPLNFAQCQEGCLKRIEVWQTLRSQIWSPYQRPYLSQGDVGQALLASASAEDTHLMKLLRGLSLRHLAILTHQDELNIARKLYPLISNHSITVRDPQPPFHELPNVLNLAPVSHANEASSSDTVSENELSIQSVFQTVTAAKTYKVVCIDDNSAILQTIEQFLRAQHLSLSLIQDSTNALVEIASTNPDVILLDTSLPGADGYEICRLLRRQACFNVTPIIMMTGNNGLIDRAQAIMAGATDFIAKPFTQAALSKIVFQHLP
jgi:two-component system, chemotaxis family, response regulator PixG